MNKEQQMQYQTQRKQLVSQIKAQNNISPAAQALIGGSKLDNKKVIDLKNYAESRGISLDDKELYNNIGNDKYKKTTTDLKSQQIPIN
jgi:hypothetical protein